VRTKSRLRTTVIWTVVALTGAVAWSVIALVRGEQISAAWPIAAALGSYAIAYRFSARFIVRKVLRATAWGPRDRCC
jgi:carbon starvation protein